MLGRVRVCEDCGDPAVSGPVGRPKALCDPCGKERLRVSGNRRGRDHKRRSLDYIQSLKTAPCTDCRETFPAPCMDFDHVRGEKTIDISDLVGCRLDRLIAELEKCELVCANCHRLRTWRRGRAA